jgi:hypothetical protein
MRDRYKNALKNALKETKKKYGKRAVETIWGKN